MTSKLEPYAITKLATEREPNSHPSTSKAQSVSAIVAIYVIE